MMVWRILEKLPANFSANFDVKFFPQMFRPCFPGFQAPRKNPCQNSRPESSAFLSNFTLSNPTCFHADSLLSGEIKNWALSYASSGPNLLISPGAKKGQIWGLQKKVMCLVSWERTQKETHINSFVGDLGPKNGPQMALFGHKSLVHCSLPAPSRCE